MNSTYIHSTAQADRRSVDPPARRPRPSSHHPVALHCSRPESHPRHPANHPPTLHITAVESCALPIPPSNEPAGGISQLDSNPIVLVLVPTDCLVSTKRRGTGLRAPPRHGLLYPERCARVLSTNTRSLLGGWDRHWESSAILPLRQGGLQVFVVSRRLGLRALRPGGKFAVGIV